MTNKYKNHTFPRLQMSTISAPLSNQNSRELNTSNSVIYDNYLI